MQYLPVVKALRGQMAMLEVGDTSRQAVEVISGLLWDVFFDDTILLMITFADRSEEKPKPVAIPGQPVKPSEYESVREFAFRWIRVANIIAVTSDANVTINRAQRSMKKAKNEPLYTDELAQWHVLNNGLCRQIVTRLRELKLEGEGEVPLVFRDEQNNAINFADAFPGPVGSSTSPSRPIETVEVPVVTTVQVAGQPVVNAAESGTPDGLFCP